LKSILIDGDHLTIEEIAKVAREGVLVELADSARLRIERSRAWVDDIIQNAEPVYGINTGFGNFSEKRISASDITKLNRNLILSHSVGTGQPLTDDVVRAAMLVRANTLAKGYSGVRVALVETLIELLNKNVTPVVPSQGSLGSSGDLCPLSHLALVFSTDEKELDCESGYAKFEGEIFTGKDAMRLAGIKRIILDAKEGLALNNGATFSAAIAALTIFDAEKLMNISEISLALSLEALLGCLSAFDEQIHLARGLQGQLQVAEAVRKLTKGSTFVDSAGRVQDAYSLRCAPQVQGAGWDTLNFVKRIISTEINAATDNPLLFGPDDAISGGNFHGEPVGMVMDFLGIALSEIAAISERRVFRLTDENLNAGLPPMLVNQPDDAGVNSGLMLLQYAAASLVLENQGLASPDSIRSLPTAANQEDHNANAMTAARHAMMIAKNTAHVLAIELYTAARAITIRLRQKPEAVLGCGTDEAYRKIREVIPYHTCDACRWEEVDRMKELMFYDLVLINTNI
jgi:histidine ammonia-lyase